MRGTCFAAKTSFWKDSPMYLATRYWKFLTAFALSLADGLDGDEE
jgi:hypothetical protein